MQEANLLRKPLFWLVSALALVLMAIWQLPDNRFHLIFCDVGQGDAALISYKNTQVLIDGGPDNTVLECLAKNMPFWDRQIEMVVATHPDADHLTGLIEVINRYQISHLVINSYGKQTVLFDEFKQAVENEGAKVHFPQKGDVLRIGPAEMAVLWPETQAKVLGATTIEREINEVSVVFLLSYGQFDALFPGDISSKVESQLILNDIEVLKVPHHGSKYSTSQEFLEKTDPKLAIISGGQNRFGHPTDEVLDRLKAPEREEL
jgi:competence protein ComEC